MSVPRARRRASKAHRAIRDSVAVYDRTSFPLLLNCFYDILHLSSGRDKVCALLQNAAKFASEAVAQMDSEFYYICRGTEDSLSDGRKIFRLFKWIRETYKIRRGLDRAEVGIASGKSYFCTDAICGFLDSWGHTFSFFYFLLDNLLWGISVGIWRSKEIPQWQLITKVPKYWEGNRQNGALVHQLGGIRSIKWYKNLFSLLRTVVALLANVLLLNKSFGTKWKAVQHSAEYQEDPVAKDWSDQHENSRSARVQPLPPPPPVPRPSRSLAVRLKKLFTLKSVDDPLLFHILEVVGIVCNLRSLLAKLKLSAKMSHTTMGLLGMVAASIGMWRNWRKVVKKKCGAKTFEVRPTPDPTPELLAQAGLC